MRALCHVNRDSDASGARISVMCSLRRVRRNIMSIEFRPQFRDIRAPQRRIPASVRAPNKERAHYLPMRRTQFLRGVPKIVYSRIIYTEISKDFGI